VHHYTGNVLRLARQSGVPVRIAHSHLDYAGEQEIWVRRLYYRLMNRWIEQHSTHGIAASRQAATALFGPDWERRGARRLLYYGIDLAPFRTNSSADAIRASLGLPKDAFVIGHVGRMAEQKNHKFLIKIFAELARREPRAYLLLVGDGELRGAIEQQACAAGVGERVIFTGVRPDVPQLMIAAMDVFLLPSLYEGLGLVGVEAQAAGLPSVVSDSVPPEMEVIPNLVRRCSLSQPASAWADMVLGLREARPAVAKDHALDLIEQSPFNIERSVRELENLYACATISA